MTTSAPDRRRRTEQDADFQRVKAQMAARLQRSLRTYVRDLREGGPDGELVAQRAFVQRHTQLLKRAYSDGHREGLRDYWQAVSLKRPRFAPPDASTLQRRIAFYLPSVVKMATELQRAWHETKRQELQPEPIKQFADSGSQGSDQVDVAAIDAAYASMGWRVQLQADVVWVGLQDGYVGGGVADPADVYDVLYWEMEGGVQHCADCPMLAAGSPYTIQELDQTPGDGRTDCGASCHCDLRYSVSSGASGGSLAARIPSDYPLSGYLTPETQIPAAPDGPMDDAQKGALDALRSAFTAWDKARGELPPLETLLAPESVAEESAWVGVSIEQLTPAQRKALDMYVDALGSWAKTFDVGE